MAHGRLDPSCTTGSPTESSRWLSVRRVGHDVRRQNRFPSVAVIQQFLLVVEEFLVRLAGELEVRPQDDGVDRAGFLAQRSEEHTSELQSLMRISYAVFCLTKKIHLKPIYYIN